MDGEDPMKPKRMTAEERYMARTGQMPAGRSSSPNKNKKRAGSQGKQASFSDEERSDGEGRKRNTRKTRNMIGGGGEISSVMPRGSSHSTNVDQQLSAAACVAAAAVFAADSTEKNGQRSSSGSHFVPETVSSEKRPKSQFDSGTLETDNLRNFNRSNSWWGGAKMERRTADGKPMTSSQNASAFAAAIRESREGPQVKHADLEHGVGPIIVVAKSFEERRSTRSMSFQGHDREKKIMPDGSIVDPKLYGAYPVNQRASNNPLFLRAPVPVQHALRAARAVTDDKFLNKAFNELGRQPDEEAAYDMPVDVQAGFRRKVLLLFNFQMFYTVALSVILTQTQLASLVGLNGLIGFLVGAFISLCLLCWTRDHFPLNNIAFVVFSTMIGLSVSLLMTAAEDADPFSTPPGAKEFYATHVFRGMVEVTFGIVLMTILGNLRTYRFNEDDEQVLALVPLFTISIVVTTIVGIVGVAGWMFIPNMKENNSAVIFSLTHLVAMVALLILAYQVERMSKQFNPDDYMKTIVFFWSDVLIAVFLIGMLLLGVFIVLVSCGNMNPGGGGECFLLTGGYGGNCFRNCCPCCPAEEEDEDVVHARRGEGEDNFHLHDSNLPSPYSF